VDVLPYANASTHLPRSRPRWIDCVAWAVGVPTLFLLAIALPPYWGAIDYTRTFALHEVAASSFTLHSLRAIGRSPANTWQACFVPLALAMLVVFSRHRSIRASLRLAALAAAMPLLWMGPVLILALILAPFVPLAILGRADGEDWSEGMVAMGTAGVWTLLWTAVLVVIVITRSSWRSEAEMRDAEASGVA
jgi:hypothetical protein